MQTQFCILVVLCAFVVAFYTGHTLPTVPAHETFTIHHHGTKTATLPPKSAKVPAVTRLYKLIPANRSLYPLDPPDVQHVFWTGGLFSTYRILDLLVVRHKRVRPVYIVPTGLDKRLSTTDELRAMQSVRERFRHQFPKHDSMFLDPYMVNFPTVHEEVRRQSDYVFGKSATRMYAAMVQAAYEIRPHNAIEWVISDHTNQQRLRAHIMGLVQSSRSDPVCTYAGKRSSNSVFAGMFANIRFVLPGAQSKCRSQSMTLARASKYKFSGLLQNNTWSCVAPIQTQTQTHTKGTHWRKIRHRSCGLCAQCIARAEWFVLDTNDPAA